MVTKRRIAIVAGGDSSEHDVSLRSAAGILSFLDKDRYEAEIIELKGADKAALNLITEFDFAYITIHGTPGENGLLQGYLEMMHIPYSCCNVLAAALTFNKYACNHYLQDFGIPISKSILIRRQEWKQVDAESRAKDIIDEIGSHFDTAIERGKTEDQIMTELGEPKALANKYLNKGEAVVEGNASPKKSSSAGAVIFVILFNLLVGIPGWIALLCFVLSIVGINVLSALGAVAAFTTAGFWGPFMGTVMLLGITLSLAAVAIFAATYFAVKYYFVFLASYIGWNSKLVKEGF